MLHQQCVYECLIYDKFLAWVNIIIIEIEEIIIKLMRFQKILKKKFDTKAQNYFNYLCTIIIVLCIGIFFVLFGVLTVIRT